MSIKDKEQIKILWDKFVNRETISYAIAGVLTTLVNFISYYLFCNIMGIENLIANGIAWMIAVIFAYIVNDVWVFQTKQISTHSQFNKITKFFGARIISFIIEEAGMLLFVDIMHFNNLLVKAGLAVIVIVINYIFSKLFIFNKGEEVLEVKGN